MAVIIKPKELVDCKFLVAITMYTKAGQFGHLVLAPVAIVHFFTSVCCICSSHIKAFLL